MNSLNLQSSLNFTQSQPHDHQTNYQIFRYANLSWFTMATNCQTEKSHSRKQSGLSVATFANVGTPSKEEISLVPWVSYTRTRSLCSRWRGFSELINVNTGPWSPKRKVGEREEAGCWSLWNAHQLLDHFSSRMDIRDEVVSSWNFFLGYLPRTSLLIVTSGERFTS